MASKPLQNAVLRPVGLVERFSTVRHNLGLYRCVCNTATYSIDHSLGDLHATLETALAKVILRHPPLCCGIINEDKEDPAFVRLESVDVSKCIDHRILDSPIPEEYEQSLIDIIEQRHRQLWVDTQSRPVWQLIVVQRKSISSETTTFDAVFAYHHAIADGVSGMVFHRSLMEALNDSTTVSLVDHIVKVPDSIRLFPPQEEMINFKISWWFLLSVLWHQMKPTWLFPASFSPWTSADVSQNVANKYESRIKLITMSAENVTSILDACREQKTTLTGLLHALIVTSLTTRVPSASSFVGTTPLSPRKISGISSTCDMAVQVCSLTTNYSPATISAIRACNNPPQLTDEVWKIARDFRTSMAAEIAKLPNDNIVGLLPYAGSIHKMFLSKMGKPRADTYQVSNIGTLRNDDGKGEWRIERTIFTQCGMATGPAFSFNVASVVGGPLTISVTWLEGAMEGNLLDVIVEDVKYALRCIADGKEVYIGESR